MSETSRRGFLFAAGAAAASSALGNPQTPDPASAASSSSPRRSYSMKLGVHMTNWQNLWRKGVISWEEIGRISAQLGFHGIELQQDNVENVAKPELKRIKDALNSQGVQIRAININNNFLAPDFDRQIKMVRDFAELCAYFEAPFERIYLGRKPPEMGPTQAFDQVRKGLDTCLPFWEKLNVVAAPEPPDVYRFVPSPSPGPNDPPGKFEIVRDQYPAGDITAIVSLLRVVNSKYFRYTLDTGCIPPEEKYIWPQLLAPYTVNMHIKEWQFNWRTNEPIDTDYIRFLEPFKRAGYDGFLDLELRDQVRGGFDLGNTVEEVSAKLTKLKVYLDKCIAA
jgi:sugar phosphate isomerase/epimerase